MQTKKILAVSLIVLALAFIPLSFARTETMLTDTTLAVTYWPINAGRQGYYCLVARLVWYTWNGEMRAIPNAKICFFINGHYYESSTTDERGFAGVLIKLESPVWFCARFSGDGNFEASSSHDCYVRLVKLHWREWP